MELITLKVKKELKDAIKSAAYVELGSTNISAFIKKELSKNKNIKQELTKKA
jgi:hypothetical protein